MEAALVAIGLLLAGVLAIVSVFCALVGLAGALLGIGFERCAHCHRFGLSASGHRLHDAGCPAPRHVVPHPFNLHHLLRR